MNLEGITLTGKNEYIVKELTHLVTLSYFAQTGTKAYCLEDDKMYVYIDVNEWVSI